MLELLARSTWVERIGWVLVHSLWQFILLAILAVVLQRALARRTAATRYRALLAAMLVMVASPVVTWFSLSPTDGPPPAVAKLDPIETPDHAAPSQHNSDRTYMTTSLPPAESPAEAAANPQAEPARIDPAPVEPSPTAAGFSWSSVKKRVQPWLAEIVLAWLAGVFVLALRPLISWQTVRRLRTQGVSPVDRRLHDMIARLAKKLKLAQAVDVLQSTLVKTPAVVGYFRPVVLLPLCVVTGLPESQLELILAHELAHVGRHDYLVNLLQTLVETLFFYHPGVWWISRQIRDERENCCDDVAMATVGSRADYGRALLAIEELRASSTALSLAARGGSLLTRIRRIAGCETAPRIAAGGILCVVLASVAILAAVTWAAATAAEKTEKVEPPATAEAFAKLSDAEQRAMLASAFQKHYAPGRNQFFETEQVYRAYESNGWEPGKPTRRSPPYYRYVCRYWRLGDSLKKETYQYDDPKAADFYTYYAHAENADERLRRNVSIYKGNGENRVQGQVVYPYPRDADEQSGRFPSPDDLTGSCSGQEFFFEYLVRKKDQWAIKLPAAGDDGKVQLVVPMYDDKLVLTLDPQKNFLPVRFEAWHDLPGTKDRKPGAPRLKLEVQESRLFDKVWTPVKMLKKSLDRDGHVLVVEETKIVRIESGHVTPGDFRLPFTKGMQVADVVEGATYAADAKGEATGVADAPNWKHDPPKGWQKGHVDDAYSLASRISADDRIRLAAAREKIQKKKEERWAPIDAAFKVLKADPPAPQEARIEAALQILRVYRVSERDHIWASAIRELITIGKPAVPRLIEELDQTARVDTFRALGFVLRGINDPRAIPAMIRAIPLVFQVGGGDYGLTIGDDRELNKFMVMHDSQHSGKADSDASISEGQHFDYGSAYREIMLTLEKMTGQSLGWKELNFSFDMGSIEQKRIQRTLFLNLGRRWAEWWSKNWKNHVTAESDAQLDLTQKALDRYAESIASLPHRPKPTEIPTGAMVSIDGSISSSLIEPCRDLDTGRCAPLPENLRKTSPKGQPSPELLAWAEKEGVDLLRIEIKPPGDDEAYYGYKPVGMKVWRIDGKLYKNLGNELQKGKRLDLPAPWQGPIASIDEKTGKIDDKHPAYFLFITRDGSCGAMQIRSGMVSEFEGGYGVYGPTAFEFKFIGEREPKKPAVKPDKPASPPATPKPSSPAATPTAGGWKAGQTLDVRVINAKTKEPLPGVNLRFGFWVPGGHPSDLNGTQTTDAQGRSEIKLPDGQPERVSVYPSKPGFVPRILCWQSSPAPPDIPKTITVALEPSTTIGGVVHDQQGKPIPGVTVTIDYGDGVGESPYQGAFVRNEKATTDKDGRWRINAMPVNISEDRLRIFLTHPDYLSDHPQSAYTPWPIAERPPLDALRAQTAVMVMRKGAVVEGRVTDETGKPIKGASIYHQEECYYQGSSKTGAVSDTSGHFRIVRLNDVRTARSSDYDSPKTLLTVEAPGYAPQLIEASLAKSAPPLAVSLLPGNTVHGRVVDKNGRPIPSVRVRLDYWQGRPRKLAREATTDAAGKFRINDVPWDRTEYDFEKPGYVTVRKPMSPSSKDYVVELRRVVRIVGTIVDAETGKPPARCTLTEGSEYEDGRAPDWHTHLGLPAKVITDGRYEITLTQESRAIRIRVEADGYMPAVSRPFKAYAPDQGRVTYDIKLTKAAPLTGTVLGTDGKPAANAEVFLAVQPFSVSDGRVEANSRRINRAVKTGADGQFEFPPEVEPYYLVAVSDQGSAVISKQQFADSATVQLKPWTATNRRFQVDASPCTSQVKSADADAKFALAVRLIDLDGKPVEGAHVSTFASYRGQSDYHAPDELRWSYNPNILSDREGMARLGDHSRNCIFARHVERGLVALQGISPDELRQMKQSDVVTITMRPQCKVFGKLTANGLQARNQTLGWTNVYLYMADGFGRPMDCMSDEGKGEFHFFVPPGTYRLDAYGHNTQTVAKMITVKPGQKELQVEPIDLPPTGLVLLEGKPAPELRGIVAWKNGGPVELADLRGKAVILAFSPGWSGPNSYSLVPKLLPLYDRYHDRGLEIIEMRVDMSPGPATETAAERDEKVAEVKRPYWPDRDVAIPIALASKTRTQPGPSAQKPPYPVLNDYGIQGLPSCG
jgi:beta-lactamase regulating signal transducer with metallopeptidase domain/protocatechuate 3,4-dioxygenase beta subunit